MARGKGIDWDNMADLATERASVIAAREGCSEVAVRQARLRRGHPSADQARAKVAPPRPSARAVPGKLVSITVRRDAPAVAPQLPDVIELKPVLVVPAEELPREPVAVLLTAAEAGVLRRLARHALTQSDARVLVRSPHFSSAVAKLGGIS